MRPKLHKLVNFIRKYYECGGPQNAPICKYDYTALGVLNEYFVFSVATGDRPHDKMYHEKKKLKNLADKSKGRTARNQM